MSTLAVIFRVLAITGQLWSILADSEDPLGARSPLFTSKSFRREASASVPPTSDLRRQFCMSVEEAVESLKSQVGDQILVHTSLEDVVIFNKTTSRNQTIQSEVFTHYMTLSHLPVTAISILLPDVLQNNSNTSQGSELRKFQASLMALDRYGPLSTEEQNQTALAIVNAVIEFVNHILSTPQSISRSSVQQFAKKIRGQLQKAARFAVQDYFDALKNNINNETASVVIAVEGFSYPGSFLYELYKCLFKSVGKDFNSPERIAFAVSTTSNGDHTTTLARATYTSDLNTLFGTSSLHSLLSTAASEIACNKSSPNFEGFSTVTERLYVVLIVTFLSATIVFVIMVLSMCYEDRCMRREEKEAKMEMKKPADKLSTEPSLLTPITAGRGLASSYSAFHQLRKKHIKSGYAHKLRAGTPSEDLDSAKYTRLLSEPESPPAAASKELVVSRGGTTVTCTEISLADMTES